MKVDIPLTTPFAPALLISLRISLGVAVRGTFVSSIEPAFFNTSASSQFQKNVEEKHKTCFCLL